MDGPSPYVFDPLDPRAPTEEQWSAMSEDERRRVVASLPSDTPRALPPEGDRHFVPKVQAREALGDWFRRRGRDVYLGSELPVYYPGERCSRRTSSRSSTSSCTSATPGW